MGTTRLALVMVKAGFADVHQLPASDDFGFESHSSTGASHVAFL